MTIVSVPLPQLRFLTNTTIHWHQPTPNKTQSYVSPSVVLFSVAKFSHKGVWKEEEDHLLKWNLRSDGWEPVEGELCSMHPRGGGGWTRGVVGQGRVFWISTHTSHCGWRGWRPPMLSDLEMWLTSSSKVHPHVSFSSKLLQMKSVGFEGSSYYVKMTYASPRTVAVCIGRYCSHLFSKYLIDESR